MLRVRTALTGFAGGPGLMTQYFSVTTPDVAAAERCRQYVHDLIGTALALLFSNQVTWEVLPQVDVMTAASGEITDSLMGSTAHTATGGGGADMAPVASAALIRWVSAEHIAGRGLQGRTFVNPVASAKVNSSGQVTATAVTAVNAALATYLGAFTDGDFQVIWHRPKAGSGGQAGNVAAATVQSKMAVLTSRRD